MAFCDLGTHPRGRARHFLAPTRDGMHVQTNQCGSLVRIFRGLTGEWDDCEGGFARHHSYECEFVSSFVYDLWYLGRKPPGTPTGTWFEPQNGKKNHNQSNKGALRLVLVLCCRPPSCAMFAQSDTVFAVLDAPKKKIFFIHECCHKKNKKIRCVEPWYKKHVEFFLFFFVTAFVNQKYFCLAGIAKSTWTIRCNDRRRRRQLPT